MIASLVDSTSLCHRYWLRTQDDDVERLLKVFTNIAVDDIKNIMQRHWEKPEERTAQRVLADNATRLVRGDAGVRQAQMASQILFSGVSIDECLEELGLAADSEHELAEFFEGCDPVALKAADVVDQNLFHLFKQAGTWNVDCFRKYDDVLSHHTALLQAWYPPVSSSIAF